MAEPTQRPKAPRAAKPADPGLLERLRSVNFGVAMRGYDRHQVDEFIAGIAKRLEAAVPGVDQDAVRRRLEAVGESTTGILTAAEETARKLQADASEEARLLRKGAKESAERARSEATAFAESARKNAEDEARRLVGEASQKAQQLVATADARAKELLDESLDRRRVLAATIERLDAQRAEIVAEIRALATDLSTVAEAGEAAADPGELEDLEPVLVEPTGPLEPEDIPEEAGSEEAELPAEAEPER